MEAICTRCGQVKTANDFYKNTKKENGLESQCKECVLDRKHRKYRQTKIILKKSKLLRAQQKVRVLDVQQCTFEEILINRPLNVQFINVLKEFVDGVLCYLDIQFSRASVMEG